MDDSDEEFAIEDIYDLPAEELRELLDSNTAPQNFVALIQRELAERQQTDRIAHALLEGGTLPSTAVSASTPARSTPLTTGHMTTLTCSPAVSSTAPPPMADHPTSPAAALSASLPHPRREDDRAHGGDTSTVERTRPITPASALSDVLVRQQRATLCDSSCPSTARDSASVCGSSCPSSQKKSVPVSTTRSLRGNFKPTPMAFDFIVAKSSVKKRKVVAKVEEAPKPVWGSATRKKKDPVVVSKGHCPRRPSKDVRGVLTTSVQQMSKDTCGTDRGEPTCNSRTKEGPPLGGHNSGRGTNTGTMDAKEHEQGSMTNSRGVTTCTNTDGSDHSAAGKHREGLTAEKMSTCSQDIRESDDVKSGTRASDNENAPIVLEGDGQPLQAQISGTKVICCHQHSADVASELICCHQDGADGGPELLYCHEQTRSPRVTAHRQHGVLAQEGDHDVQESSSRNTPLRPTLDAGILRSPRDTALACANSISSLSRQDSIPRPVDGADNDGEANLHEKDFAEYDQDAAAIINDAGHNEDAVVEDAYSEDALAHEDYSEDDEEIAACAVHVSAARETHDLSTMTSIEEDIAATLVSRSSSSGSIPVLISTPGVSRPASTQLEALVLEDATAVTCESTPTSTPLQALVQESAAAVLRENTTCTTAQNGSTALCAPVRPLCVLSEKGENGNARDDEQSAPVADAAPCTQKSRKPPVPRCPKVSSKSRGAFKLDYCGLEEKDIVDYSDVFSNVAMLFSNATFATVPAQLLDLLNQYRSFCNIVTQFDRNVDGNYTRANGLSNENSAFTDVFLRSLAGGTTVQHHLQVKCNTRFFKVVQHRTEVYNIVTRALHRKVGWEEMPHGMGKGAQVWNLLWTWSKPRVDYGKLLVWQKVNHYPQNKNLTRKDTLKRCIERYTRSGTKAAEFFNILPKTFILPKEYVAFVDAFSLHAENAKQEGNLWIMKPAVASRGRGIQLIDNVQYVSYGELTVIQQYISRPLLLDGLKWDLRVYVLVTSFQPLEAFFYKDGFARFATVPYNVHPAELTNRFIHLTNSSVNRLNKDVDTTDAQLLGGTKINFEALKKKLAALGVPWSVIWQKMIEVVLKSLVMAGDHIPHQPNSFEVFGYDIIFDDKLEAWLIEVNASPSLNLEHLLDEQVKLPLIDDTLDVVSPPPFDREALTTCLVRGERDQKQLNIDLTKILAGQKLRKYGELPEKIGNYHPIAPSKALDHIMKVRAQLFNK